MRWRSAIGREEGVVLFFLPHQFNCSDSSTMSLYTLGFQLWSGKGGHKKRDRGMDRKKERKRESCCVIPNQMSPNEFLISQKGSKLT